MFVKLSDRIYYFEHNHETDRPVLGYIKGDRYTLMVDAGNSACHAKLFMDELCAHALPKPDFVSLTHWHWDHTYGLSSVQAVSIASNRTNEQLKAMQKWEWSGEAMAERIKSGEDIEFCSDMIAKEYEDRSQIAIKTADVLFEDALTLDLGGVTCKLVRIGGPHSSDSTIVFLPEEKIVFLGDCAAQDVYNGWVYDQEKLIKLMHDLSALDFDLCVGGHCEPWTKEMLLEDLQSELNKLQI